MPIFEIEGPDGIYEVDAPDEASAVAAFQGMGGQGFQGGAAGATALGAANGFSLGFGDELGAGLGAVSEYLANKITGQPARSYDELVTSMRNQDNQAAQQYPVAYTGGQIGGGVASALAAGGAGATTLGRLGTSGLTGLPGVAARTGLAAGEGAAYGVASALGNDTPVGEGALMGAAFGTGGNLLGEGVQAAANAFRGPQSRAQEYVARAAGMDFLTPEMASQQLQSMGPNAVIADLGPNMRSQASALASTPGSAQTSIRSAVGGRAADAGPRIVNAADEALGVNAGVLGIADDIIARRSEASRPLYEAAYAQSVPVTDGLTELLKRPALKSAFSKANDLAANAGEAFDPARPTVKALDYTKRALDDMIDGAKRSGNGNEARILTQAKNSLVGLVDEAVPEYAQARRIFSGETQVLDALEEGTQVFKNATSPEALSRQLANLDDASREAFVQGARQQITDIMGTARNDAQAAKALFAKGYNREKLNLILGVDEASGLLNAIDAEEVFGRTRNAVMGGSDTAPKANAQSLIASPSNDAGLLKNMLNMNFGNAAGQAADMALGGISQGRNDRTNAEIARLLMSSDVSALAPVSRSTALRDNVARSLIGLGGAL